MKTNRATAAVVVGLVGVLALGACSSGSDQAEADREAAPASSVPSNSESPTISVAMPPSKKAHFDDVTLTHSAPSRCKITNQGTDKELIIECTEIGKNFIGDNVFIRVPDYHYSINVRLVPTLHKTKMETYQRDWAYSRTNRSALDNITWKTPYTDDDQKRTTDWGVGIEALEGTGTLKVIATVTYSDFWQ